MREILFKGKRTDNGEWIEGDLLTDGIDYITAIRVHNSNELGESALVTVIPETVGQYTGLTDKNGKKIFEGDIIKNSRGIMGFVEWQNAECCYLVNIGDDWETMDYYEYEVIGNIWDNKELLGVEK